MAPRSLIWLALALVSTAPASAQSISDSLRIYYVGKPVGWERYSFTTSGGVPNYNADLDYIDRGRRTHIQAGATMRADWSPASLVVGRVTDTSNTPILRVASNGVNATIHRNGIASDVALPAGSYAISPYVPLSQHLGLIRAWEAHGSPKSMPIVPGGPVNQVRIAKVRGDTIKLGGKSVELTRYSIDGVVWGIEYAWTDAEGRLAMFATAAGGLSFKGIGADLVPAHDTLFQIATDAALTDLARISRDAQTVADGSKQRALAFTNATLIDGTGKAPVADATIVVVAGRITAVGPGSSTKIPDRAHVIDLKGKAVVPGLWDSHAHLHQLEWPLAYIANGVTTVRDMGAELPWITDLRQNIRYGRAIGPSVILAGLVDGPGPNAFGALSAATPSEGKQIVAKYSDLGFDEIKLYDLLAPDVVRAITDEAHTRQMIVTGHVPRSLGLLPALDAGMDQVAHLPVRGAPGSDSLKATIAKLVAKKTVVDPTASWGEIGGHSQAEPLEHFQPGAKQMPPVFLQTRAAGWGSATVDTATAHGRLARTLETIGALYKAGVPIVAGTDEGVPGFSVYRELELYVQAGMTPMDAIRSATSVPARAMGVAGAVGTIEINKRADLLVLDENPLTNISNVRTGRYVVKDGRVYEIDALRKLIGFVAR